MITLNFSVVGRTPLDSGNSNYVVIGAFAMQSNAKHFAESAKKFNFSAELDINPTRNLFYVYVLHTGDSSVANAQARKIRTETPFNDTWVYRGLLGKDNVRHAATDINPVTGQTITNVESKVPQQEVAATVQISEPQVLSPVPTSVEVTATEPIKNNQIEEVILGPVAEGAKGFIFKITATTGETLKGDVDVIDSDRLSKAATYEGNKAVSIKPINKSGRISLVCEVFGYRKEQIDMNYNLPDSTSGVFTKNDYINVPFELAPLKKGDIAIMYNVFFFKDAAVMRPESRYEVTTLLSMMKENPKLKIKLHGHTNGNASGKIIRMGEPMNFFSLTGSQEGFGSAKELSESRAEAIRDFLIFEGIDPTRFSVKAWGGKKTIHDKKSSRAHENVRVEVEILED